MGGKVNCSAARAAKPQRHRRGKPTIGVCEMQAILRGILDPRVIARLTHSAVGAPLAAPPKGRASPSAGSGQALPLRMLAMTCRCWDLSGQTAERSDEEQGEKDKKSKNQVTGGSAAGLLRGWLRRFHVKTYLGLSAGLGPLSALSLAKIGTPARSARAMASLGRLSSVTSFPSASR